MLCTRLCRVYVGAAVADTDMKNTSQPECPRHKSAMIPGTLWANVEGKALPVPIYMCASHDCLQVWDAVRGHHTEPENVPTGGPLKSSWLRFVGR